MMRNTRGLKRTIASAIAAVVLAVAVTLGFGVQSASAAVRFSDGTVAGVDVTCNIFYGDQRSMDITVYSYQAVINVLSYYPWITDERPTYIRFWSYDQSNGSQWIWGPGWTQVNQLGGFLQRFFSGPRMPRWIWADYYRLVNGIWEYRKERVILKIGTSDYPILPGTQVEFCRI